MKIDQGELNNIEQGEYYLDEPIEIYQSTTISGPQRKGPTPEKDSPFTGVTIYGDFEGPLIRFIGFDGDAAKGAGGGLINLRLENHHEKGHSVLIDGVSGSQRPSWVELTGCHFLNSDVILDGSSISDLLRCCQIDRCRFQNAMLEVSSTANTNIINTMFHSESVCRVTDNKNLTIHLCKGYSLIASHNENVHIHTQSWTNARIFKNKWIDANLGIITNNPTIEANDYYYINSIIRETKTVSALTDLVPR